METSLSDIKDLVEIAKPFVDPIISTLIQPKINKLASWLKKRQFEHDIQDSFFEDKFKEYISRTYSNCQNINVLIFQNQQIKLKEIYYPLTIKSEKDGETIYLDDFKASSINEYNKILISDTAGMGKSTLSKFITLKAIENNIAIPIHIELRNLREDHSVIDEILHQINPIDKSFDEELIFKFLELGQFLIVFDGFDEIQFKDHEAIIKDIRDFINKTSSNQFVLTSRPEGSLASFGDFQSFNILSLKQNEAFELILKYDTICPIKVGAKLISDIKQNFKGAKELLGNPFLVSLIYSTYTYSKDIPSNKATFYDEIYSALFKRHDLSKDGWTRPKKSKLDIHQFKVILRQLAFDTSIIGTITYTESEIIQNITIAKNKSPGVEFNAVDFLDDLLTTVPLFQKDGNKVKWAHKSLQDYFCADFIAFSNKKDEIIKKIYESEKQSYMNMLDLFYELDFKTFRNIIIRNILKEFIDHYEGSYNNFNHIDAIWVKVRKTITFKMDIYVFGLEPGALKINELLEYMHEKISLTERNNTILRLTDQGFLIAQIYDFKRLLIELLANKNLSFIEFTNREKNMDFKLENHHFDYIQLKDEDSEFNTIDNFLSTNNTYTFPYNISYEKSVIELEKIYKQMDKEKEMDFLRDI